VGVRAMATGCSVCDQRQRGEGRVVAAAVPGAAAGGDGVDAERQSTSAAND